MYSTHFNVAFKTTVSYSLYSLSFFFFFFRPPNYQHNQLCCKTCFTRCLCHLTDGHEGLFTRTQIWTQICTGLYFTKMTTRWSQSSTFQDPSQSNNNITIFRIFACWVNSWKYIQTIYWVPLPVPATLQFRYREWHFIWNLAIVSGGQ